MIDLPQFPDYWITGLSHLTSFISFEKEEPSGNLPPDPSTPNSHTVGHMIAISSDTDRKKEWLGLAEASQDFTRSPVEKWKADDTEETAGRWGTNTPQLQKPNNPRCHEVLWDGGFSSESMITSSQVQVRKGRMGGEEQNTPRAGDLHALPGRPHSQMSAS